MALMPSRYYPGVPADNGSYLLQMGGTGQVSPSSHEQLIRQVLQASVSGNGSTPVLRRAINDWLQCPGHLSESYQQLNPAQRDVLRQHFRGALRRLVNLSQESHRGIFYRDLLNLARRELRNPSQIGALLLQTIAAPDWSAPADIQAQAQEYLAVLQGRGTGFHALEIYAEDFLREATHPAMLIGMGIGSLVSSATRLGLLSRFSRLPGSHILANRNLAYLSAQTTAFALEVPSFYFSSLGVEQLLHPEENIFHGDRIPHELYQTGAMLGFLKLGGAGFRGVFNLAHGVNPIRGGLSQAAGITRISQLAIPQLGMFSGIFAYHQLGPHLGLDTSANLADNLRASLITWLQFNIAGSFANRMLGPRYRQILRSLETSSQSISMRWNRNPASTSLAWPAMPAGSPSDPINRINYHIVMSKAISSVPPPVRTDLSRATPGVDTGGRYRLSQENLTGWLENPMIAAEVLPQLSPRQVNRLLKHFYDQGRIGHLALALEARRFEGDQRVLSTEEIPGMDRLLGLESEFAEFLTRRQQSSDRQSQVEALDRWRREYHIFGEGLDPEAVNRQAFVKGLAAKGVSAKAKLMRSVRENPELSAQYFDLAILREFLISRGFNQYTETNGKYLANLLRSGEGNCVSMSLLYTHLASRAGRSLDVGMIGNHLYLLSQRRWVIDSVIDFGLGVQSKYAPLSNPHEVDPHRPHQIIGFHLLNLSNLAAQNGNYLVAREGLSVAEAALPKNPRPLLYQARLFERMGRMNDAAEAYLAYANFYPENIETLTRVKDRLLRLQGRDPGAIAVYQGLSDLYIKLGDPERAEEMSTLAEVMSFSE